jgi:hypothetical protein
MLVKAGWTPYFVNFMFDILPGRQFQRRELMVDEICRVYSTLVTNDVRRPRSPAWNAWLPRFFGCFDFPVYKNEKVSLREVIVNCGLHFNGLYFISPRSRLGCSLGEHFAANEIRYYGHGRPLHRIHVTEMTYGDMTDYALKAYKNGRISYDDVLVLPRSLSELPKR